MARARFVKPDFFKHGELYDAELTSDLPLRLAFAGLWTQADRAGRFVWKPRELKLDVLPYDDVDFGDVLDALERFGFVRSYVVDGKRYGVIPTFADHQPFHKNEPQSKLPSPPAILPPPPANEGTEPANVRRKPSIGRTKPANGRPRRSTTVTVTTTDTTAVTDTEKGCAPGGAPRLGSVAHPPDIAPPVAPAVALPAREEAEPGNWPVRIVEVLAMRGIKASPGKVGGMLDVAVRQFKPARVIRALEGFLDNGVALHGEKPGFVTLERFCQNPAHWVKQTTPMSELPRGERDAVMREAAGVRA